MADGLFESFARMVDNIPTPAIPQAIELHRDMLEDDLAHERLSLSEMDSVLNFCKFVNAVIHHDNIFSAKLPIAHIPFYRKTVVRMIEAGQLPFSAREQFDHAFCSMFFETLSA